MADISAKDVMKLREMTGAGMMDCKSALKETGGDMEKAVDLIRKKTGAKAAKKSGRATSQGWLGHYVHSNGRIGVLVEVKCETDFVAKNEKFQDFIKDLSMHIAAMNPIATRPEDVPADVVERERNIYLDEVKDKPAEMQEKIIEGKMRKYFSEVCFLEQPFVKDDKKSVQEYVQEMIATIGENIEVGRFHRMELGAE